MVLIPGATKLTTLDKTGFRTADGLSVEMKGMCIGSVMKSAGCRLFFFYSFFFQSH